MWRRASFMLVCLTLSACAGSAGSHGYEISRFGRSAGRDVITAAEIVAARVTDAYQAVAQLRPEFFRRRARSLTTASVLVYLDGTFFGGPDALQSIPLEQVRMIQYVPQVDADMRWGRNHPAGAILVTTAPRRP